jgi:hypothetical protein
MRTPRNAHHRPAPSSSPNAMLIFPAV